VHFLLHGEDGKYSKMLTAFVHAISRGTQWQQAWNASFGGIDGFDVHWRQYWQNLPANPTDLSYARATVATLTSFLARAGESKQKFATFPEFAKAAIDGTIQVPDADWLPPGLLQTALGNAAIRVEDGASFTIGTGATANQIICVLPDGTKISGKFTYNHGLVATVTTDVTPPPAKAPATTKPGLVNFPAGITPD
jgi:hypothetical protein